MRSERKRCSKQQHVMKEGTFAILPGKLKSSKVILTENKIGWERGHVEKR
jgi:hypothetical protein